MIKNSKQKLLFTTIFLLILLNISTYASLISNVHAEEITAQQKGLVFLNDVVGVDLSKYTTTPKEYLQDSYFGVLPQENVRFNLLSNGSKLDMLCTLTNGTLQIVDVLERDGTPFMTKSSVNVLENAKAFLTDYQGYSGDSFYGELNSMLNNIDANENATITSGNVKLEATYTAYLETFRWTYTYNNVEAPSKCVVIGYKNGFLKNFIDTWDLYKIGSTSVALSEEEAINIAIERAKTYSWKVGSGNNTYEVKNFNVTKAMVTQLIFCNSILADRARSEDHLKLYPMWRIGVGLDKPYPGNVYGIYVDIWADTREIRHVEEVSSTMDLPPELFATTDENENAPQRLNDQRSVGDTELNPLNYLTPTGETNQTQATNTSLDESGSTSISWITSPALFAVAIGVIAIWLRTKKHSSKHGSLRTMRSVVIGGVLTCLLIYSSLMSVPISKVNAAVPTPNGRAIIWGSESTGQLNHSRKTTAEIAQQESTASQIQYLFAHNGYDNTNGYYASNYQGSGSIKSKILSNISDSEQNYLRLAVVDFDHGVGRSDYSKAPFEFHFMFEDNVGMNQSDPYNQTGWIDNHMVYDMDIYNETNRGKTFFAFINTCLSACLESQGNGTYGENSGGSGIIGMPYAWTHGATLSENGFLSPDGGAFCYIGFPSGSASLCQIVQTDHPNSPYWMWVEGFFAYALIYDISVKQALDYESEAIFQRSFYETELFNSFTAIWPGFEPRPYCKLVVYGNSDIHLKQHSLTVLAKDQNNNDLANKDVYLDNIYNIANTGSSSPIFVNGGYHTFWVNDFWEANTWNRYTFQYYTYDSTTNYNNPITLAFSSNKTVTAHFSKASAPEGDVDGDGYVNSDDLDIFLNAYPSTRGDPNWNSRCDFNCDGVVNNTDRNRLMACDDIMAIWHLDEGSGSTAYDSSLYGNNGTIYGATWASGRFGSALSFDGVDDYVQVPDSSSLDITNEMSIELWFKPTGLGSVSGHVMLARKQEAYAVVYSSDNYGLDLRFGDTWYCDRVTGAFPYNNWYHLAVTFSVTQNKIKIYKNGNLIDTIDHNGQSNSLNSDPLRLGSYYGSYFFNGIIDDVCIYNRTLSADEIADLAKTQLTVLATDDYLGEVETGVFIDGQYVGESGSSFTVLKGTHTILVDSCIDLGWYSYHFDYFIGGGSNNPTTLTIASDTTITAVYHVEWY